MARTQEKVETVEVNNEALALQEVLAQLKTLREEVEAVKKERDILKESNESLKTEMFIQAEKSKNKRTQDSEVTLYFNNYGVLDLRVPGLNLRMTKFGEERIVSFSQFQQLVGQYRKFFDRERLLVGPNDIDLVDKYKVKAYDPSSSSYIHYDDIEKMASMTGRELQDYYDNLSPKSQNGLLTLWMNKCYNKEPGFYTIEKMDALNRASRTKAFDLLIDELRRKENK